MLRTALASEINVLARALNRISEQNRRTRDFTLNTLRHALREVIASFPVYRTYIDLRRRRAYPSATGAPSSGGGAGQAAQPGLRPVRLRLPGRRPAAAGQDPDDGALSEQERAERCRFVMKFQQLTGPVMAKGVEDTAFYVYNRLVSLNEVGGDPAAFGTSVAAFHRQNAERARALAARAADHIDPRHQAQRGRARPDRRPLRAAARVARRGRPLGAAERRAQDPGRGRLRAGPQRRVPALPDAARRLALGRGRPRRGVRRPDRGVHAEGGARGEGPHELDQPDAAYEEALRAFVRAALDASRPNPFLDDFAALRELVAHAGAINALAQQLLKLTAPGVPDIYQGTELWDFSLVDPDNRRPVDYARRTRLLRG